MREVLGKNGYFLFCFLYLRAQKEDSSLKVAKKKENMMKTNANQTLRN